MANYNFITDTAVTSQDSSIEYKQSTATAFITPTWSSAVRGNSALDLIQINYTPDEISKSEPGWLRGRRPTFNLQFPRGYYNK